MRNSTKVVAMVVIEGDLITVAAVTVAGVAVVDRAWPESISKTKKAEPVSSAFLCVLIIGAVILR